MDNSRYDTLNDPQAIHELFNEIYQSFPSTIRFPFQMQGKRFTVAYSILGNLDDRIVLFLADSTDRSQTFRAELDWDEDGSIPLFTNLEHEVYGFRLNRDQIVRERDAAMVADIVYRVKANADSEDSFIKPLFGFARKTMFDRVFAELIVIELPQEVFIAPRERKSERISFSPETVIPVSVSNPTRDKAAILQGARLQPREKAILSRYWDTAANRPKDMTTIFEDFMKAVPNCLLSPYFPLGELIDASYWQYGRGSDRVRTDYPSFANLKRRITEQQTELYSEPRFVVPLMIYHSVEGHALFFDCEPAKREYYRMLVYALGNLLEQTPHFDITAAECGRLSDISSKGMRFISYAPNHRRLGRGSQIVCEFTLQWSDRSPIRLGIEIRDVTRHADESGRDYCDIRGHFAEATGVSNQDVYRVRKYVSDHLRFVF